MRRLLTERYRERLAGVLSCYDRIIATGTLPGACYAKGMTAFLSKRLGKLRIVENADLPCRKKCRHPLRIARAGQGAGDDDPGVAGEHPGEALAVALGQQPLQPSLPLRASDAFILSCLVPAWPA